MSCACSLVRTIVHFSLPAGIIQERARYIHQSVLAHSRHIREANFTSIHPDDLELLFASYDERFFDGQCWRALDGRKIEFRLAPRMTRQGGRTTRFQRSTGAESFEIAIASDLLLDAFGAADRLVTVCGLECGNRLEALQRIFEHEILHLAEQLCWRNSDCAGTRFQELAERFFRHRAHTHNLITRRERAAQSGIRAGSRVTFEFEGRRLAGRVNRITKRATVLVETPEGRRYSDGLRYAVYYVPLASLTVDTAAGQSHC